MKKWAVKNHRKKYRAKFEESGNERPLGKIWWLSGKLWLPNSTEKHRDKKFTIPAERTATHSSGHSYEWRTEQDIGDNVLYSTAVTSTVKPIQHPLSDRIVSGFVNQPCQYIPERIWGALKRVVEDEREIGVVVEGSMKNLHQRFHLTKNELVTGNGESKVEWDDRTEKLKHICQGPRLCLSQLNDRVDRRRVPLQDEDHSGSRPHSFPGFPRLCFGMFPERFRNASLSVGSREIRLN